MKVGFTGTQKGMTEEQFYAFQNLLGGLDISEFHHGDCIGADSQAHYIAIDQGIPVVIHPPIIETKRAWCEGYVAMREPKDYLVRNHNIVDETDFLIATPAEMKEVLRSGTWATLRYTWKKYKNWRIVLPDGSVK